MNETTTASGVSVSETTSEVGGTGGAGGTSGAGGVAGVAGGAGVSGQVGTLATTGGGPMATTADPARNGEALALLGLLTLIGAALIRRRDQLLGLFKR